MSTSCGFGPIETEEKVRGDVDDAAHGFELRRLQEDPFQLSYIKSKDRADTLNFLNKKKKKKENPEFPCFPYKVKFPS